MSFILENTILFSTVEWGIKDLADKLTCDEFKSWLPMGRVAPQISQCCFKAKGALHVLFSVYFQEGVLHLQTDQNH